MIVSGRVPPVDFRRSSFTDDVEEEEEGVEDGEALAVGRPSLLSGIVVVVRAGHHGVISAAGICAAAAHGSAPEMCGNEGIFEMANVEECAKFP